MLRQDLLALRLQLRLLVLQLGKGATPFLGRIRGQLDATCKQPEDRQALLTLGNRLGAPVLFLECRASLAEVERRLRERERRGDAVSDANWAVALREQDDFPTFADLPDRCHLVINKYLSINFAV
jgi:hypothetical protein